MHGLGFFSDEHLQDFVVSLADKVTAFVETGAEEGKTTRWSAFRFRSVFTCEIDEKYLASLYWGLPANVCLYNESSPQFLVEIHPLVGDFPLFFLDAHWMDYWPLRDELKTIEAHYHRAIIIVHDCAVPGRADFWTCRGGGADHEGPVLDWDYIRQAIDTKLYRLFYPNYTNPKSGMPGYCVMFKECEPIGKLGDFIECPIT